MTLWNGFRADDIGREHLGRKVLVQFSRGTDEGGITGYPSKVGYLDSLWGTLEGFGMHARNGGVQLLINGNAYECARNTEILVDMEPLPALVRS